MPTIEFANHKQCKHWIQQTTTPERYAVYITEKNEIIITPSVSTSNLKTGYLIDDKNIIETLAQQLEKRSYRIFRIKTYYWSSDMTPRNTKEKSKDCDQ